LLDPLLIGAGARTFELQYGGIVVQALSQSPSHRGRCSDSSRLAATRADGRLSQSPSHRGRCSDADFTVGAEYADGIQSQSPSHRGRCSDSNDLVWVGKHLMVWSQSPSHRGRCSDTINGAQVVFANNDVSIPFSSGQVFGRVS